MVSAPILQSQGSSFVSNLAGGGIRLMTAVLHFTEPLSSFIILI